MFAQQLESMDLSSHRMMAWIKAKGALRSSETQYSKRSHQRVQHQ